VTTTSVVMVVGEGLTKTEVVVSVVTWLTVITAGGGGWETGGTGTLSGPDTDIPPSGKLGEETRAYFELLGWGCKLE
jgi:hypothetical protein